MLNKIRFSKGLILATTIVSTITVAVLAIHVPNKACPSLETVQIGKEQFRATYACTIQEQMRGLSHQSESAFTQNFDAMIFVFNEAKERSFWMHEMQFALDIAWVKDGQIVKMQEQIPYPAPGEKPVYMYSAPFKADAVIEFPAGTIEARDIRVGDRVQY